MEEQVNSKPIGILGGTFDPIHLGHIYIALAVLEKLKLQEIKFLPCYQPVHRNLPSASPKDRVAMINIGIKDYNSFTVDEREFRRGGPSYMIDTLISLRNEYPTTPLCLILGMDAYSNIQTWKRWQELLEYAHFIVVTRPCLHPSVQALKPFETSEKAKLFEQLSGSILFLDIKPCDITATEIRRRIKEKQEVTPLLPPGVYDYILEHRLYNIFAE